VRQRAHEFDLIHFHTDLLHFTVARTIGTPTLTTLHSRLDIPDLWPMFQAFAEQPLVSISDYQRLPMPTVRWAGTVHHGIPADGLAFSPVARGYLAFLGRISPEKRPDLAIKIARMAGMPLKIAAKVDEADVDYWNNIIKPLIDAEPSVEYVGEVSEKTKSAFLGDAAALLFPIDWPEPFGLVMIEAMACGTPVIAFNRGSVPEVIDDDLTGYVVDSIEEAVAAVPLAGSLDRTMVRKTFERRFSADRMTKDYLAIYRRLLGEQAFPPESDISYPVGVGGVA
jgi:glycosyltransferase involved in cell wall biosynthesis